MAVSGGGKMHTIKYRGCVAQQNNKTLEVFVQKAGCEGKRYTEYGRLSGKELRSVVMRYLREVSEDGER